VGAKIITISQYATQQMKKIRKKMKRIDNYRDRPEKRR
jgi:hypothetical protein